MSCQLDGITRSLCCECCGRELSSYQTAAPDGHFPGPEALKAPQAQSAAREAEAEPVIEPDQQAPLATTTPPEATNCENCGAPSVDGVLCSSCQQSFDSWLGAPEPSVVNDLAAPAASPEESRWSESMTSAAAPVPFDHGVSAAVASPQSAVALVAPEIARASDGVSHSAELTATPETIRTQTARPEEIKAEAAVAAVISLEAPKPRIHVAPAAPQTQRPASAPRSAVVEKRPAVPPPPRRRSRSIVVALAAVVVAAVGAGAYWFRIDGHSRVAQQELPSLLEDAGTVAEPPPTKEVGRTASKEPRSPIRPPAAPSAQPRSAARADAKAPRPSNPSAAQVAFSAVSQPPIVVPVSEVAPPPREVPEPAPFAASVPPLGPFFETTDVNESPQVASRVEPQLPDDLRGRAINEILVVRVLVSQGGHPSRVSLLRRSKAGPGVDNAVIAAVNRWAFSPAKRRGEAVSCWLNLGVPVGHTN